MAEILKAIGLMSGTSLDGIDAALLETDGEGVALPGAALTLPYDATTRAILRQALDDAVGVARGSPVPYSIREAERISTEAHAGAVLALLEKARLRPADVALIGYHGQTILHRPRQHWTWQIGDGAALARRTDIDVVNDFRSADVKAGGEGAPLVPLYHAALVKETPSLELPVAVVNIGGVANVTYISRDTILAFDTGPGNAPIDDWAHKHTGKPVDESGVLARRAASPCGTASRRASCSWFGVRVACSRTCSAVIASRRRHPVSAAVAAAALSCRTRSSASAWSSRAPSTWPSMDLTSQSVQSVGRDQSSSPRPSTTARSSAYSAVARRMASSCSRGAMDSTAMALLIMLSLHR